MSNDNSHIRGLSNNTPLSDQGYASVQKQIGEAVRKRRELGEETKRKVFVKILESEPNGMSTQDLVKAIGRDRRTIQGICQDYENEGLIKKTNKKGQYHLTSKAKRIDNPSVGSFLVLWNMIGSWLFELGDIAMSSSMDFVKVKRVQQILNSQKRPNETIHKEAFGKFLLFEFALRVGASILYIMIQSMKYADPSLHMGESLKISESMKDHLVSNRYKGINPVYFKVMFEELLLILEHRLWKEYDFPHESPRVPPDIPEDERMDSVKDDIYSRVDRKYENFQKRVMKEKFEVMEKMYKDTFPTMFESMQDLAFDMVYEPGLAELERMEKEDPDHVKCGGELSKAKLDLGGRIAKRCLKCKRWFPVEKSNMGSLQS
jgi:predicted transcriptional regulator